MITKIVQIGKSSRFKIFLDDKFVCNLEGETIVKNKLAIGSEIDANTIERLQFESEKITAFEKAIDYLSRGIKSAKQMKTYLIQKGYLPAVCDHVLSKLSEYKYLNDQQYAHCYVRQHGSIKSSTMLRYELMQKGIDKETACQAVLDCDDFDCAKALVQKNAKNKTPDTKNKQKIIRSLMSKGFDYETIRSAMREVLDESWN